MAAHCQDCSACCTVFDVPGVTSFGETCKHVGQTGHGVGCMIYAKRPVECMTYVCLWLDSQRHALSEFAPMPESMRPDVCHVVMGFPGARERDAMFVYPLPGHENAWRLPPVSDYLREILARGAKVVVVEGAKRWALKGDMAVVGTEEEFADLLA